MLHDGSHRGGAESAEASRSVSSPSRPLRGLRASAVDEATEVA